MKTRKDKKCMLTLDKLQKAALNVEKCPGQYEKAQIDHNSALKKKQNAVKDMESIKTDNNPKIVKNVCIIK